MNKSFFNLFFLSLALAGCQQQEKVVPFKDEIPWDKIEGKLIAFDGSYAFVADGKTKKLDTILKQPPGLSYGQYFSYGSVGACYSSKRNLLLSSVTTDIYRSTIKYFQLDGGNPQTIPLPSSSIQSPTENSNGSIAYLSRKVNGPEIESVWIDQKKIFTFSSHNLECIYILDWHPSNQFLLLGLGDKSQPIWFPGLRELNVKDTTLRMVLEQKPGTLYFNAQYSPNGNRVVFIQVDSGGSSVCVVNRDGTGFAKLTNVDVYDSYPAWSPDGSKIAYTKRNEGIYIMNADGANNALVLKGDPNKWIGNRLLWLP